MDANFGHSNMGEKENKEKAEEALERLGFFDCPGNRKQFDDGLIDVYSEHWNMEASVILDRSTGQMAFVDWRSV